MRRPGKLNWDTSERWNKTGGFPSTIEADVGGTIPSGQVALTSSRVAGVLGVPSLRGLADHPVRTQTFGMYQGGPQYTSQASTVGSSAGWDGGCRRGWSCRAQGTSPMQTGQMIACGGDEQNANLSGRREVKTPMGRNLFFFFDFAVSVKSNALPRSFVRWKRGWGKQLGVEIHMEASEHQDLHASKRDSRLFGGRGRA